MKNPPIKLKFEGLELLKRLEGQFISEIYVTEEILYFNKELIADSSIIKLYLIAKTTISIEISVNDIIIIRLDEVPIENLEPNLEFTMEHKIPYVSDLTRKIDTDLQNRLCSQIDLNDVSSNSFKIIFEIDGFEKFQLSYKPDDLNTICHRVDGQLVLECL